MSQMMITTSVLKKYLDADLNCLLIGERGVGKSAMVMKTFEGLNYRYFSASTLDPWVDLVGTPKAVNENGKEFIRLVRPEWVVSDDIEAIFFDELNRAPDKVLNACLELIQFKSINGFKFPKLRVVWAAINPETEDHQYSVNHLDPAHMDRFHVHLNLPFAVNEEFFFKRFPFQVARNLIDWWNEMPSDIRKLVSPRRLEYVGDAAMKGMNFEHFVDSKTNISKLRSQLKDAPFLAKVMDASVNEKAALAFLKEANNVTRLQQQVLLKEKDCVAFWNKYKDKMPGELVQQVEEKVMAKPQPNGPGATSDELMHTMLKVWEDHGSTADRRAIYSRLNSLKLANTDAEIRKTVIGMTMTPAQRTAIGSMVDDLCSFIENGTFGMIKDQLFDRAANEVTTTFKLVRHINSLLSVVGKDVMKPLKMKVIAQRLVRGGVMPEKLEDKLFYM